MGGYGSRGIDATREHVVYHIRSEGHVTGTMSRDFRGCIRVTCEEKEVTAGDRTHALPGTADHASQFPQ